jgi:FkbM family methyltransferase
MLGGRSARTLARATFRFASYRSLLVLSRVSAQPVRFVRAYFLGGGVYPSPFALRTPLGVVTPTLYSQHDVLTVNEVFFRRDYPLPRGSRVVVDIGSNIGISALYFLTRSPAIRAHLFEPDPRNAERLRHNLAAFDGRWILREEAVGDREGIVAFGREGTGRYGAIGRATPDQIDVHCRHINDVLSDVLELEGRIDFLKIDTEGLENATVAAIDRPMLGEVGAVCFETRSPLNPWPERFSMSFTGNVCRLSARARSGS